MLEVLQVMWNITSMTTVDLIANIDRLISSMTEDIKHLMSNAIMILWGGANDVSKNNSQDALKHITNFVNVNSHTNIILLCRGSVRSTRGLGPTMTARGQSIGISIGMLPQTLIM